MPLLKQGLWCPPCVDADLTAAGLPSEEFRDHVTADAGAAFPAEPGRYHLYASLACPFAHRALLMRQLKSLHDVVGVSIVSPRRGDDGWSFAPADGYADTAVGVRHLHELYVAARPAFSGRVVVPVLWDRASATIVSNNSGDIMRMFDTALSAVAGRETAYSTPALLPDIDALNAELHQRVNTAVYRVGFAGEQATYDEAVRELFGALDELDARLGRQRYLLGDHITECDWRLFTTLVRFDLVYYTHFKTNLRRIADYPHLSGYVRELYQHPGVRDTVDLEHIKLHYYYSHDHLNPRRIVPIGPQLDLDAPHGR